MQTTRGTSLSRDDNTSGGGRRRVGVLLAVAVTIVLADQLTKAWAVTQLADGEPVQVLGELLQFRLIRNSGAAFSLATDMTLILTIAALAVVVVILRASRRLTSLPWAIALGGILGGALGNLTDRVFRAPKPFHGHVVDFLELPRWPVFNLADCAIVGSAILVAVLSLRGVAYDSTAEPPADPPPPDSEDTDGGADGPGTGRA
ncbi:MAG: signal peptidase II [Jiangellaceae bacterium]